MIKYLIIALFAISILFITSCSDNSIATPEPVELTDTMLTEETDTEPQGIFRIGFNSLEEWWEYEFDSASPSRVSEIQSFGIVTQEKSFIVPMLPKEYGEYALVRDEIERIFFYYINNSSPKIDELIERYGENGYIQIYIEEAKHGWTLDNYVQKARENFKTDTFGSTQKGEMRYEYHFWSGIGRLGKPFSSSRIMTFHEDKYYINIWLPYGDEKEILNFIDELRLETYTVGDVSMIETVAEEARTARVEESAVDIGVGEARRE